MVEKSGIDVVKTFIQTVETKDRNAIQQFLSGDFVVRGLAAQPLNKNQLLDLLIALKQAQPDLSLALRSLREDKQFAQSDRIDGILCLVDAKQPQEGEPTPSSEEQVSFTVMGNIIESMILTPTPGGELERKISQFSGAFKHPGDQSYLQHRNAQEGEELLQENQGVNYNKQSNLYDPKGKSYTPSRDDLDYAPQVDTSLIEQQKGDEATTTPLFESEAEQLKWTRRQPNRQQEEQRKQQ
jgi:hypothetical protein